ncbi:TonB-dependent receptor [Nisaea acidiphila]|uniref:TonB-dependent receptor n=1 Tax=Nisaea acidiphila TaxID=1862145 RepID=A0A9J7AQ55_9PROT|nr:TonB-dependent receptor [Nisaea acidiphila]UUX49528.1 TonB-dependent receptor [Nisaea acidiphila]
MPRAEKLLPVSITAFGIKRLLLSATCLVMLPVPNSLAQQAGNGPVVLQPLVVSATRSEEAIDSIPGTVQVIETDKIEEALGAEGNLGSFLGKYVPGISPGNGTLASSGQTFRGRSVQVLVNGAPQNISLRNNSRILNLIDPSSIERIEVVAGASSIYGDGATGGIVNIITKSAAQEGLSGFVSEEIASTEHDLLDGAHTDTSGQIAYGKDRLSLLMNGRFRTTGDMYDGAGERIPEDPMIGQGGGSGIRQYNVSGQGRYEGNGFDLGVYGSTVYLKQDIDFYSNYLTDPVSFDSTEPYTGQPALEDTQNVSADLNVYETPVGDLRFQIYYNDAEKRASRALPDAQVNPFVYSDPGVLQSDDAQSVLLAEQAGFRSTAITDVGMLLDGAQLNWGFDYGYNDVTQTLLDGRDIIAPMEQHSYAGFAQLSIPVTDLIDVRAGVRHERFDLEIDDFVRPAANFIRHPTDPSIGAIPFSAAAVTGASTTFEATVFNIGAVAHVMPNLDLFGNYSEGYSVPDVGAFTRRALDPTNPFETSFDYSEIAPDAAVVENYEAGARFGTDRLSVSFSAFLSESDKGTNITADALTLSQNKERIYGAEMTVAGLLTPDWDAGALLNFTEGEWDQDGDGDIDDDLPNSRIGAPFRATVYSGYRFAEGFRLYGEMLYTSSREADDGGSAQMKVTPTTTFNARLTYDGGFGKLHLGVDNILDREQLNPTASSVRNTPVAAEGRRFYVGFKKEF